MRLKLATSAVAIYGYVEFEKVSLTVQCANCEVRVRERSVRCHPHPPHFQAAVLCASQLKRSDGAHLPITWPSPGKLVCECGECASVPNRINAGYFSEDDQLHAEVE